LAASAPFGSLSSNDRAKWRAQHHPACLWYCSLGGGLLLLAYAIYREVTAFIVGQILGIMVTRATSI
jgi:lipid-A-disaccharide synthase-like uncharacterized protein